MAEPRPLPALPGGEARPAGREDDDNDDDDAPPLVDAAADDDGTALKRPAPFRRLHRRAGQKFGYYLAETKHRFIVTDNLRELRGLCAIGVTTALALIALLIGRAFDQWALFILAALLVIVNGVWTWFMVRITTTFDRRSRRMVQESVYGVCRSYRTEYDLDDIVRALKQGEGRQARMVVELSSGEEIPITFTGTKGSEELKTIGPNRINNFLRRIRGEAVRAFPPPYVLGRAVFTAERDGDLTIAPGTFIKVLESPEDGWWRGKIADGSIGWFPAHFTTEIAPSELPKAAPAQ